MQKEEAKKILDYWTALEMLIPNTFPDVRTEESDKIIHRLICDKITKGKKISDILKKDRETYSTHVEISGDIDICYGKFEIQNIYDLLCSKLHVEDTETDIKSGFVCLFALKITRHGNYIEESFDISPFIWAVNECINNESINVKKMQPSEVYCLKMDYENYLKCEEISIESRIEHIYDELTGRLCGFIQREEIVRADMGIMIYDRIRNDRWSNGCNADSVDYTNLQQSHIIKDLEMVSSHIDDNNNIVRYISALKINEEHLNIKDDFELIKDASCPELYSLGKWPSRYNPALMQQIAINIANVNSNNDKDIDAQTVFSVNGPPGTGKTTLLKEVIVDNIVNRAMRLTEYRSADDAFTECKLNGKYDQYTTKYFKPDESLDDFIMLVASSNNNAVENITKELPKASDVVAGKTMTGLFDTGILEQVWDDASTDYKKESKLQEIYFTDLAQKIFGNDSWGLISVPLGNRKNIKRFCDDVIKKIIYIDNESIHSNYLKFQGAKDRFIKQLNEVNVYKDEIVSLVPYEEKIAEKLKELEGRIDELSKKRKNAENELDDINNLLTDAASKLGNVQQQEEQLKNQCFELEEAVKKLREEIIQWEGKLKLWERLWPKRFHSEKHVYIAELSDKKTLKVQELEEHNQQLMVLRGTLGEADKSYSDILAKSEKKKEEVKEICKELDSAMQEKEICNKNMEMLHEKHEILGIKTLSEISPDNILEKVVQESSFYTSKRYDEAREKLFYEALQLHKWFVLSSTAMFTNFRLLAKIWQAVNDTNNKPYEFEIGDKREAFTSAFKSLFLLTPVISTTFAAVQSLLNVVTTPKSLGTLIIDEAGQAAPQLAVGALWRCKKALVVGDPKQIQPVVTIPDCIYNIVGDGVDLEYHNKAISIQTFADRLNKYGGKVETCHAGEKALAWVGCPLIVHRRCIEPMFSISNEIAYNWTMINATAQPKEDVKATLLYEDSKWFQVIGSEKGNKNHYVREQGIKALSMVIESLHKQELLPDIYIISPFKSVADEMKKLLRQSDEICQYKNHDDWIKSHCGTVHTFQGKGANEVIFLLGCDENSIGAVNWVNDNIVNVAVTRAKYRLYVIGDYDVWKTSRNFQIIKKYIDIYRAGDEVN